MIVPKLLSPSSYISYVAIPCLHFHYLHISMSSSLLSLFTVSLPPWFYSDVSTAGLVWHTHYPTSTLPPYNPPMSVFLSSSRYLPLSCILYHHFCPCSCVSIVYPFPPFLLFLNIYRHCTSLTHQLFCHYFCPPRIHCRHFWPSFILLCLLPLPTSYLISLIYISYLYHIGSVCLSFIISDMSFATLYLLIYLKITYH